MKKIQISRQDRQISRTETSLTVLPPPIGASEWKPIFKLLALIVLSDRKVFPESVKAFQDSLIELRTIIDPSLIMTRHMILDWLKLNKDDLANMLDSLEFDDILLDIISEMRSLPYKLDVITSMVRIAVSDGEYSKIERMLIKKTILFWNVGMTSLPSHHPINSVFGVKKSHPVQATVCV